MTATSGPGMSLKTEMLGLATHRRAAARVRQRAARRPLDRHARPRASSRTCSRPCFSAHGDVRAPGARADQRGRHLRDHGRGLQHRGAVPDAGDPALRPGDRAAQGDRSIRSTRARSRSSNGGGPSAARARGLRALPRSPSPASARSAIPGCRAATTWRPASSTTSSGAPDRERRDPRAHEREADPQARPAEAAARPVHDRRATATRRSRSSPGAASRRGARGARARAAARACASSCWCRRCSTRSPRRSTRTSSRRCSAGLVVEQSHQGQLYRLLRMFVDVPRGVASLARSGANPITPRRDRRPAAASWRMALQRAAWPSSAAAGVSDERA